MAVPMTIPFALVSLLALGQPLTLFSVLALFLLFGIVKKNGILQVDYTNVLRQRAAERPEVVPAAFRDAASESGDRRTGGGAGWRRWVGRQSPEARTRLWAILEANRVRLRPILMTTLMLVTAMIPIALGQGPGAANRADMAKVIVGGQGLSLILSLLVTPVTYALFDDLGAWLRRRTRRARPVGEAGAHAAPAAAP
jgi:HAE1 family hydrophobic/amphiphilic exporter-1